MSILKTEDIKMIDINSLPEISAINDTDKIYVFKPRDGKIFLEEIPISDLSVFFFEKSFLLKFDEKFNELRKLSSDFMNYLNTTFPTESSISSIFATEDYFNSVYETLQNKSNVETFILNNYTTVENNATLKQTAYTTHEELKNVYLANNATNILYQIPTSL